MLIMIDPHVIVGSLTDGSCEHMLDQVFEKLDTLRVAVDDTNEIKQEYFDFLDKYIDTHEEHVSIILLQEILLVEEHITLPLPTELPAPLADLLEGRKYPKIEEKLLRIVANAKNLGLKLLLAGRGINARLRDRQLNNPQVRRALLKEIPWLDLYFASDRKELFAPPPTIHYNARIFELLVARFLQTEHPTVRCIETPDGVKNQLGKAEEIDLYGYEQDGDTLTVWVGECKLREEGKESSKPITRAEIAQLRRKMSAASQYEHSRSELAGKSVQIQGLIISNAKGLFDDFASRDALSIGAQFWQAELTSGWTTDLHWTIYRLTRKL